MSDHKIFDGRKTYMGKRYNIDSKNASIPFLFFKDKTVKYILHTFLEVLNPEMIQRKTGYVEGVIHERIKNLSVYKDLVNVLYINNNEIVYEIYVREDCVHKIKRDYEHEEITRS